eukprot:NODE_2144_length_2283_cov_3.439703.p1 GENE.NODE_2144_length_2283_cov_3.439703~~NODE_2144_length_2283_cov_3.439703.p1  ORF type:complete len:660 (+),score=85.63 NODE_2144_length_2283_cov_3.439703:140-1981(+)
MRRRTSSAAWLRSPKNEACDVNGASSPVDFLPNAPVDFDDGSGRTRSTSSMSSEIRVGKVVERGRAMSDVTDQSLVGRSGAHLDKEIDGPGRPILQRRWSTSFASLTFGIPPLPSAAANATPTSDGMRFILREESGVQFPSSPAQSTSPMASADPCTQTPASELLQVPSPLQYHQQQQQVVMSDLLQPPRATTPKAGSRAKSGLTIRGRGTTPELCPMFWSESEISAFLSCLGISHECVMSILGRRLRVNHLLKMSEEELCCEHYLKTPIERHVSRKALQRFLEFDRLQNTVHPRKHMTTMDDGMMSEYLVSHKDLVLEHEISQGGYGNVYAGRLQPSASCGSRGCRVVHGQRLVAVKDMKGSQEVRIHEIFKESRVMKALGHKNLCAFVGICTDLSKHDSAQYILSELLDCSLFDLVHQTCMTHWGGTFTTHHALKLAPGIGAGIAHLHSKKLVHADMKSSNVLIDHTSSLELVPKICDFGHAAVRAHPAPHSRCGTPQWASPEALRNEAVEPAADIFSFGVILWEMVTQTLPHQGLSFAQVIGAVGWGGWILDSDALPESLPALRALVRSCLSYSPPERPTAREVRAELRHILKTRGVMALSMLATALDGD